MEVIMANNKTLVAAVLGWAIITLAVVGGAGFYFGLKYEQNQTAAKKAAVQDALKAVQPAPAVAQAPFKVTPAPVASASEPSGVLATPTPVPVSTPQPQATPVEQIIVTAAATHGMSALTMLRIARCESTNNPAAINYNYTAIDSAGVSHGHPMGLFQHVEGYWPARAAKYGYPGVSVFDPAANANVTAAMMANEGTSAWECK
jgi:hypothetical protein